MSDSGRSAAGLGSATGLDALLGLEILSAGPDRVVARLQIAERHLQPYGVIHGGVHAAIAETVASLGAVLAVHRRDPQGGAVGLENHTTFVRAARAGTVLVAEATPIHAGRRTQVWAVLITAAGDSGDGRELARSTVRLLVTRPDALPGTGSSAERGSPV